MKAVFIVVLLIMQVKRGCLMMRWLECMRANFKLPHERTRAAAGGKRGKLTARNYIKFCTTSSILCFNPACHILGAL